MHQANPLLEILKSLLMLGFINLIHTIWYIYYYYGVTPYAGTGCFKNNMGSTKLNAISYAISKVENGVAEWIAVPHQLPLII